MGGITALVFAPPNPSPVPEMKGPLSYNAALGGLHEINGLVVSKTVTVEVQLSIFPMLSVTTRVTVFIPAFEQVKMEGETVIVAIPAQEELLPLSICKAVKVALPVTSK